MSNHTTDSGSCHTILTAAQAYSTRGWVVHRLSSPKSTGKSAGKRPLDKDWQHATAPPTDDQLNKWFANSNQRALNLGLVCGEASGVTVIDLDRQIYADIFTSARTLRSARTPTRSHVYFKYNPRLEASKHHNLGIEVLSNGNNAVLPPSTHASGDTYQWIDPEIPLAEMPEEIETKLRNLFKREDELKARTRQCRPCFARLLKKDVREATDFNGAEGRELMVAWGTDLKAAGATLADCEMWAKIVYGDKFDQAITITEWRNLNSKRTWRCETVSNTLGGLIECDCAHCKWHNTPAAPTLHSPPPPEHTIFSKEDTYLQIIKEILKNKGENRRQFTKIFKMVRAEFANNRTPSYSNLIGTVSDYSKHSIAQQKSRLKQLGVIDDNGLFTEAFYNEYEHEHHKIAAKRDELVATKHDSEFFEDHIVEAEYDYENTMDVIRATPTVKYKLPECPPQKIDYFNATTIQIIKMNHVGGNPVIQLPLSYHYRCGACGGATDLSFDVKSVPCTTEGCKGGSMTRVKSQDTIRPAFASRVVTDDLNSISIISLTEIPQGEFIGAVFLCRNKSDYYLFMIATEELDPTNSTVDISPHRHAIWQIIDLIDQQHEDRIGKHIHGMDWYKAAILLAYLANCKNRVSTNCLIIGDPGVGKTATPRLYMATLTPQQKVIDAMQLTGPGLHGSMTQIKIGDTTINVPEAGLLVRHRLVVIDELLENRNSLLPQLKSALVSSTISREVAGNRTQTPKYATAIATSNPPSNVRAEQIRWMDSWLQLNRNEHFEYFAHPARANMADEWTLRGLDWRSGQPLADMDRYPLTFYVRDPSNDIVDYDLGGEDNEIDNLKLTKLLYDSDINEYFSFCGRLKVDWQPHTDKIIKLAQEVRKTDTIHSKKRLGQNVTLMLQLSAQINGRTTLTDEDFDFVRELASKTCEWIAVDDLIHDTTTKPRPIQDWTIKSIMVETRKYMKEFEGSSRYYHTTRGYNLIIARLEDMGAPVSLIDSTIERYRQNPNQ